MKYIAHTRGSEKFWFSFPLRRGESAALVAHAVPTDIKVEIAAGSERSVAKPGSAVLDIPVGEERTVSGLVAISLPLPPPVASEMPVAQSVRPSKPASKTGGPKKPPVVESPAQPIVERPTMGLLRGVDLRVFPKVVTLAGTKGTPQSYSAYLDGWVIQEGVEYPRLRFRNLASGRDL